MQGFSQRSLAILTAYLLGEDATSDLMREAAEEEPTLALGGMMLLAAFVVDGLSKATGSTREEILHELGRVVVTKLPEGPSEPDPIRNNPPPELSVPGKELAYQLLADWRQRSDDEDNSEWWYLIDHIGEATDLPTVVSTLVVMLSCQIDATAEGTGIDAEACMRILRSSFIE